jgi:hypothetical protein
MQDSWGLEDSLVGIRLFSEGGKLVPCPTASAFLLDQPAAETDDRLAALERNAAYVREQLDLPAHFKPSLRANMDETDLLVVITEQGENRNPREE